MTASLSTEQLVAQALARAGDPREAFSASLRAIVESRGWRGGVAWEPDPADPEQLTCVAVWTAAGSAAAAFAAASKTMAPSRGQDLPGRVWAKGSAVWLADLATAEDFSRRPTAAAAGYRAGVAFPLLSGRGAVGVVEFFDDRPVPDEAGLMASMETIGAQLGQLVERRRAEQSAHVAKQRHRAALLAAIDAVVTMDHEGRVIEFNPAAEATFGYTNADAIGREMAELIVPPDLRERHRRGLARYLAGGHPRVLDRRVEIDAINADGERFPVELTITRIDVPGPAMFTAYLRDITERHRAEAELRNSRARIVQAGDAARRQIERDLHDGAQQQLVSVAMSLRVARSRVRAGDVVAAETLIQEAATDLTDAIKELRELARGIHPAVLTEGGLRPALQGLVQRSVVAAHLVAVPEDRLPSAVEAAAYFIVAEGLTNVARHSGATLVAIELHHEAGLLRVKVSDNGSGGALPEGGGLRGLVDRLSVLHGRLQVHSPAGDGTTLLAEIPTS